MYMNMMTLFGDGSSGGKKPIRRKASISITRAGTVTGMAVIVVTAEDGITMRTYTKFNAAAGNVRL